MSGEKPNSFSVFSSIDAMVSKPVVGSDGAASWQEFSRQGKHKSRGQAPHAPLHKVDRISGIQSIEDERKYEQKNRQEQGHKPMGCGYSVFKRKHDLSEIESKKRKKLIIERKRPENVSYFLPSATFVGWKEDYVYTTRDSGTGYYWDGADSVKKLLKFESNNECSTEFDSKYGEAGGQSKDGNVKVKKKIKHKIQESKEHLSSLPDGWEQATDASGNIYFFNRSLNKSVWEKPTENYKQTKLADGWKEGTDPRTGRTYYYNHSANKTSWEKPVR